MKNNITLSKALWSDCENDEERFNFLLSVCRAWETGIIAKELQNEVAMAFKFRSETLKQNKEIQMNLKDYLLKARNECQKYVFCAEQEHLNIKCPFVKLCEFSKWSPNSLNDYDIDLIQSEYEKNSQLD